MKPNHIVGVVVDRQGRTVVAADNGVFELRQHMNGESFELLAASEVDQIVDEVAEHERQVNESVRSAVDASREREKEENGRGITSSDPQDGNVQTSGDEKVLADEVPQGQIDPAGKGAARNKR